MNTTVQTIGIAILSGLLTTLLIEVFIRKFWREVVLPWYENRLYKDVEIAGRWHGRTIVGGEPAERIWQISRRAHCVKATVTATSGQDKGEVYKMEGEFKNLILTGSYVAADRTRTDRGTYAFKLQANGTVFDGVIAGYSSSGDCIEPQKYTLTREQAQQSHPTLPSPESP